MLNHTGTGLLSQHRRRSPCCPHCCPYPKETKIKKYCCGTATAACWLLYHKQTVGYCFQSVHKEKYHMPGSSVVTDPIAETLQNGKCKTFVQWVNRHLHCWLLCIFTASSKSTSRLALIEVSSPRLRCGVASVQQADSQCTCAAPRTCPSWSTWAKNSPLRLERHTRLGVGPRPRHPHPASPTRLPLAELLPQNRRSFSRKRDMVSHTVSDMVPGWRVRKQTSKCNRVAETLETSQIQYVVSKVRTTV